MTVLIRILVLVGLAMVSQGFSAGGQRMTVVDPDTHPRNKVQAELVGFDQLGTVRYSWEKRQARRRMTFDGQRVTVVDSDSHLRNKVRAELVGFDQFGAVRYSREKRRARWRMTFPRVPPEVVTVRLNYRTHEGRLIETFSTSIDLDVPVTILDPPMVDVDDPVVRSFAFIGCNRIADGAASDNLPSTANVANLIQDFTEIPDPSLHSPVPSHLVFVGDLVVNHVPGSSTLASQLLGWKAVYQTTPLSTSDVELVTIAGNHELLQKVEQNGEKVEIQNPPNGEVFSQIMSDFIPTNNGPTQAAPNRDGVARDESRLSFTFRSDNLFFVQLNTDTYTGDDTPDGIGLVPLQWLEEQLLLAQDDPAIEHVFVLGHKPIVGEEGAGETISPTQGETFRKLLCDPTDGGTPSKVRGYFAAHAHYWQHARLDCPSSDDTLVQIINGNGGTSPEQAFFEPPHGFFGYSVIGVTQSGAVVLEARGRFITTPDDAPDQAQTTVREHRTLYE